MWKQISEHPLIAIVIGIITTVISIITIFAVVWPILSKDTVPEFLAKRGWAVTIPSWYRILAFVISGAVVALQITLIQTVLTSSEEEIIQKEREIAKKDEEIAKRDKEIARLTNLLKSATSTPQTSSAKKLRIPIEAQRQLLNVLKKYGEDHATAQILFVDMKHSPLADELEAIFKLAGWTLTSSTGPLVRPYAPQYIPGIEVHGLNKHLVEIIVHALTTAGLPEVRPDVIKPEPESVLQPDHQRHVRITIGHFSE